MNDQEVKRLRVESLESQRSRVSRAIEKGELAQGEAKEELESILAKKFNRKYVLLVSNGFSSIFLSLKVLGLKNSKVLTSPVSTCFAMVNAIKANGLVPYFADINTNTMSVDHNQAISNLDCFEAAVVPNHFGGLSEVNKKGIPEKFLIEDAAQSFTSSYRKKSVSDVTILSFYPTKIVNGIDGGAILTDNELVYTRAKKLASYDDQFESEKDGRYNFKLSNINAAYTLGSLDQLSVIEKRMEKIFSILEDALKEKEIKILNGQLNDFKSKFLINAENKKRRNHLVDHFSKSNIETSMELYWVCEDQQKSNLINAKKSIDTTFSIPFHPFLTEKEITSITKAIKLI